VWKKIRLQITPFAPPEIVGIGINKVTGKYALDDIDEGAAQEFSAQQLLENIFPLSTYRSPQIKDGRKSRELTDLMAVSDEGIVLVESKVFAVLTTEINRGTDRRVSGVEKQIGKAINQLGGAIRRIRAGESVLDEQGEIIHLPENAAELIQAIVLISSMNPFLNWESLAHDIIAASRKNRAFFHILDLVELQRAIITQYRPKLFHLNMCDRWESIVKNRNAFVRFKVSPSNKE
jgi:hypothetical protein